QPLVAETQDIPRCDLLVTQVQSTELSTTPLHDAPPISAWATKVAGLSTSLMVSVPAVEISAARLVSVRLATAAERTAASLVPAMWMVPAGSARVLAREPSVDVAITPSYAPLQARLAWSLTATTSD